MTEHFGKFSAYCWAALLLIGSICIGSDIVFAQNKPGVVQIKGVQARPVISKVALFPYHRVRAQANSIAIGDVRELRFFGMQFEGGHNPIIVTDTPTITRFVRALRRASGRSTPVLNGIDILEIHFRSHKRKNSRKRYTRDSIELHFNTSDPADCFGPQFHAALLATPVIKKNMISSFR